MPDFSELANSLLPGMSFLSGPSLVNDALPLAIKNSAFQLGVSPVDLATAIGYETAGTFDPWKKGPTTKWGTHRGLIQWGEPQAAQYGVNAQTPTDEQMVAVTQYLKDRGLQPGMGLKDIYSTINAGRPGLYNASDRPGMTVAKHVDRMAQEFGPTAQAMIESKNRPDISFDEPTPTMTVGEAPKADINFDEPAFSGTAWSDVGSKALENAPSDLWNVLSGYVAGSNPVGSVQQGLALGESLATPEGRDAFLQHYKNYGSVEGIKQNIAEHPVGTISDVVNAALLGRGVLRGVPESVATRTAVVDPVAEAAIASKVDMPSVVNASPSMQNVAGKVVDLPFAGTPLEEASNQAVAQMGTAKERLASGLGSGSADLAGQGAREGITQFVSKPNANVAEGYSQLENQIKPFLKVPLANTRKALFQINARRAASKTPPISVDNINNAVKANGLTYEGIKDLRSRFGESMKKGELPSITKGEHDLLYGGLSEDLKASVSASSGQAGVKTFDYANNLARLHAERRTQVSKILGATNDEGITDRILAKASSSSRGDLKTLSIAKSAMNKKQWDDVASAAIAKMGEDKNGFSPEKFLTAYNGKLTPGGKRLLFDKETRKGLDHLATLSTAASKIQKYRNTSKTGSAVVTFGALIHPVLALKTLGGLVGGRALATYLSRPLGIKYITNYTRAYTAKNQAGMAQALAALRNLSVGNQ